MRTSYLSSFPAESIDIAVLSTFPAPQCSVSSPFADTPPEPDAREAWQAYSVNRVLGAIPLLGNILTGGEGEGLFAVTYAISGSLEALDVSVNPLSVLAPGFLRNLFDIEGGESSGEDEPFTAVPQGGKKRD